ncbi:uncharacterized protein PAC_15871 [Phialocephala subalpina]|uniref:Heterokaryon incompatibility domain-containing protein n=1 Tax=Phialocephala subalpina TaxID=576137 RepID=A0A1L7XLN3_9HELO|nr:uncharacterized protein PAC_15871 [Phialocephala subalpina]
MAEPPVSPPKEESRVPEPDDDPSTVLTTASAQSPQEEQDGLEFQIALDALATGNTEPLKLHLARIQGLDPSLVSIRSSPWNADDEARPGSKLTYVGEMDQVGEPDGGVENLGARKEKKWRRVELDVPDELFTYQPLEVEKREIRLLRLGPPDGEGIIRSLEMQSFPLNEVPKFYALSYVWGQPDLIMPLPVNGRRIMITQNLFKAIQTTFNRYVDVWLWADGICINQEDLVERGSQVGLMGSIYGEASLVVAHTGHHRYAVQKVGDEENFTDVTEMDGDELMRGMRSMRLDEMERVDESALKSGSLEETGKHDEYEGLEEEHGLEEEKNPALPEPGVSQSAISLMNYLSRIWSSDDDYALKDDEEWRKRNLPDTSEGNAEIWLKLFSIWSEDWFYRSWVTQEAVLGKKVVLLIDDTACSLDFVMKFWERARKRDMPEILKHGPLADEYSRIMHLSPVTAMNVLRDSTHPQPETLTLGDEEPPAQEAETKTETGSEGHAKHRPGLLRLLSLFRMNLASDPRDKVYSFLGLAKGDELAKSIAPDYSETNTTTKLYRNVAVRFVENGRGPELLQYSGLDHSIPELPSWAPDWSHQTRSTIPADLYNCSGPSTPRMSVSPTDPNKLLIRGAIVDRIKWNGMAWRYYSHDRKQEKFAPFKEAPERMFPPFSDEDSRCLIRTMALQGGAEHCSKFGNNKSLEDAMARTLCMDRTWRGERTNSDTSFLESFEAFQRLYGEGPGESLPEDKKVYWSGIFAWIWDFNEQEEGELRKKSWPFEVAFQEAHKGRRFCATREGYLCTAPYNTERGDRVVLFEGFKIPFILRREDEDWKIVGDCYVHGIMDGELVIPVQDGEAKPDEVMKDANGDLFALRTSAGFAEFHEFSIV